MIKISPFKYPVNVLQISTNSCKLKSKCISMGILCPSWYHFNSSISYNNCNRFFLIRWPELTERFLSKSAVVMKWCIWRYLEYFWQSMWNRWREECLQTFSLAWVCKWYFCAKTGHLTTTFCRCLLLIFFSLFSDVQ